MGKKIVFSLEDIELIKKLTNENYTNIKIAEIFNCSESKIIKEKKKHNIVKEIHINIQDIIEYYKNSSIKKTAKFFQISQEKIKKILLENNVKLKDNKSSKKYVYNEDYFKKIDTEDKAYWLGFICADGYINVKNKRLILELKYSDRSHIEKFKKCINSNNPIFDYEQNLGKSSRIVITGGIFDTLYDYGFTSNKSYELKIPYDIIPSDFIRHFIRGYFDGDGSIYFDKNKNKYRISFVSLENVLNEFKSILKIDNKLIKDKRSSVAYYLLISKEDEVNRILDYLYLNSNIYLDRKYDLYKNVKVQRA